MKIQDGRGAELLGKKMQEQVGDKVLTKVRLNFEEEITYHLGKTITLLYGTRYINAEADKEIIKIKKFYDKHEEAVKTLKKILKEDFKNEK